jgi:protein-arginine kinase activator protein McsA
MKTCFKCGLKKPLSEFYKHKQMADGHLNKCKQCAKKDVSKNYAENIEHYKAYERARSGLPHRVKAREDYEKSDAGKIAGNECKAKWTRRNPIKRMANVIVGNAVRDGKLIKPSFCESCGSSPNRIHGHHDDYAFPLVVRWLCPGCHNKWHKENGEGLNAH